MAESNTASISEMDFKLKISNISKFVEFHSPQFPMQGFQWKVNIKKTNFDDESSLAVYLVYKNKTTSTIWSAVACATFKLMPFDSSENPLECRSGHYVFDQNGLKFGFSKFIGWNELIDMQNSYVKNDAINMDIKIEVADPNEKNKSILKCEKIETCCDEDCVTTYRLKIINIESLLAIRSPKILLRKLPWYFTVHRNSTGGLSVRLRFVPFRIGISCKSKMTVKLISSKGAAKLIEKVEDKSLNRLQNVCFDLVTWDGLLKPENGYVNDNSIVIEAEVKTSKPEGVNPNDQEARSNGIPKKMNCAICLGLMDKQEISSTSCGHLFCTVCITECINKFAVCPSCGVAITLEDVHRVYLPL